MSEALRGRLPEEVEDEAKTIEDNIVTVILQLQVNNQKTAVIGVLRSVLYEAEPELDVKIQLDEALTIVSADQLFFLGFELHHGERVIRTPGPFTVKGARIDEINAVDGMCLLSVGLKPVPKRPTGT